MTELNNLPHTWENQAKQDYIKSGEARLCCFFAWLVGWLVDCSAWEGGFVVFLFFSEDDDEER